MTGSATCSKSPSRAFAITAGPSPSPVSDWRSLSGSPCSDRWSSIAAGNDWRGIVVHGAVRDAAELAAAATGIKALALSPRKSGRAGTGAQGVTVTFAGVTFRPGNYLWADADGIVVAERDLTLSS